MNLKIKKLHPGAKVPTYGTEGAACFDLYAVNGGALDPTAVFRTGLAFEVPEGHVMLIYSRSGHAFHSNTRLANCVGVIDHDFRGEVRVKLTCDGPADTPLVRQGDRIAQAMVVPVDRVEFEVVDDLSSTERGAGGFGSTGVR